MAAAGTAAALIVLGIPTVLIPNGLFTREIEPTWWSYPVWIATSVLSGLLAATYAGGGQGRDTTRRGVSGGVLAWFAVGCPVCNKPVLLLLGTSGALTWFEPIQPLLAVAGLALLAAALRLRLRSQKACALPTAEASGRPRA